MPALLDEYTGTKDPDLLNSLGSVGRNVLKTAAVDAGRSLVDEIGARTGIAVPKLGPEGAASLNVPRGGGTGGVEAPNARNTAQSKGGMMDMLTTYWKPIAAVVVVLAVLFFMKRK